MRFFATPIRLMGLKAQSPNKAEHELDLEWQAKRPYKYILSDLSPPLHLSWTLTSTDWQHEVGLLDAKALAVSHHANYIRSQDCTSMFCASDWQR